MTEAKPTRAPHSTDPTPTTKPDRITPSRIDEDLTQRALAALDKKEISTECPRCRKYNWSGYAIKIVATHASEETFPVDSPINVPVIMLVCLECGWTSMHSLVVLGVVE